MKELYIEDLASHSGHESCMDNRKVTREALTVVCIGWVLSPEKKLDWSADAINRVGRQHRTHRYLRDVVGLRVVVDPIMYRNSLHGNWEILRSAGNGPHRESARNKPMMHECRKSDISIVPEKSLNEISNNLWRKGWREGR